jgi:hypothetical protein
LSNKCKKKLPPEINSYKQFLFPKDLMSLSLNDSKSSYKSRFSEMPGGFFQLWLDTNLTMLKQLQSYLRSRKTLLSNIILFSKDLMSLSSVILKHPSGVALAKNSVDSFNLDSASANCSKFPSGRKESRKILLSNRCKILTASLLEFITYIQILFSKDLMSLSLTILMKPFGRH